MNIASEFVRNVVDRVRRKSSMPDTPSSTVPTGIEERLDSIVAKDPGILTVELAQILGVSDPGMLIGFADAVDAEVTPDGRWYLRRFTLDLDEDSPWPVLPRDDGDDSGFGPGSYYWHAMQKD